jgi:hypothetical protein
MYALGTTLGVMKSLTYDRGPLLLVYIPFEIQDTIYSVYISRPRSLAHSSVV